MSRKFFELSLFSEQNVEWPDGISSFMALEACARRGDAIAGAFELCEGQSFPADFTKQF